MGWSSLKRFARALCVPITRYGPTNRAYRRGLRDARLRRWCTSYRDAPALADAYARGFDAGSASGVDRPSRKRLIKAMPWQLLSVMGRYRY